MNIRRAAGIVLAIACLSETAFSQGPARPSFDWFVGTWDITYEDAVLGRVSGQAKVTQSSDDWLYVRYLITDPRDQKTHELTAFNVRQQGNVVTMALPMGGPSAALSADGNTSAAPAIEVRTLRVPLGDDLRASLEGTQHTARVGVNPAVANPQLRLVRKGERLEGEWIVRRDSETGFKDARLGRRDTEPIPGPPPGVRYEIMRGPEVWQTARMVVQDARRPNWQSASGAAGTSTGIASVSIRGRNLPSTANRKSDVRFTTPLLTPDNSRVSAATADSFSVAVDVDLRAVPGPKSFVVTDPGTNQQAHGVWVFDWPVLSSSSISFSRRSLEDHYEPTTILYPGELFYVEADAAANDPGNARFYGIETTHPEPVQFHLVRDAKVRTKYRAGPFLLLSDTEAIPRGSGAIETQQMPLDHTSLVTPRDSQPFVVRADTGDRIRAYHIAAQSNERVAVATAEVADEGVGEGRYQVALAKARELRKLYPEDDRYVVSRFAPLTWGFSRRTVVTEADHAALILLLDELTFKVAAMRRMHQRQFSKAELVQYGAALTESVQRKIPEPLFAYQVPAFPADERGTISTPSPIGAIAKSSAGPAVFVKGTISLDGAVHFLNLLQAFGTDRGRRDEYVARAVGAAIPQLVSHLGQAELRLGQVDISQPEELLRVVKPAYAVLATPLVQDLVRRSRPDQGEPAHPRWVADEPGRVAVRGIADFMGAIAVDEQLASYQWGWLGLVSAPAFVITGFVVGSAVAAAAAGAAVVATTGEAIALGAALAITTVGLVQNSVELGHNAGKLSAAWENRDAAYDVAPVAGYGAYNRARNEVSNLKLATGLSGLAVVADAWGTVAAVRGLSQMRMATVPSALAIQSAVQQALAQGADTLSPAARTNLAFALTDAVEAARKTGVGALTPAQRNALRASFPDGIPSDVAKTLKISPDDPNFVIKLGDSTVDVPPFQSRPSTPLDVTPAPRVPPETSSNPLIRRLYTEAEATARIGTPEAQARMARLERAAANWERLPPDAKGIAQEAVDTLANLRRQNPALAALDEADAVDYFNMHSRRRAYSAGGANRAVDPHELVAEYAAFKGAPRMSSEELARAANISGPNAEAVLFAADARMGPPRPAAPSSPRQFDPSADTIGDGPRRPVAPPPEPAPAPARDPGLDDVRRVEIAERLKQMGVADAYAEVAAIIPAARNIDARAGAAAAAMNSGIPPDRVMQQLRINRQQLEPMLDDYLRRFEMQNDGQRRAILARYFGDPAPPAIAVPPARLTKPPAAPRGLDPLPPPPADVRRQVESSLQRMGVSPEEIKTLPIDDAIARSGPRPAEVAAGLSRRVDVDSRTAARALGTDEKGFAGLVDQYEAKVRPSVPAADRAAEIGSRLRADDVTEPYTRVLQARQERIDAALRDVGIERGDPSLTTRGLDPESVVVGEALSRGVSPEVLQSRRGLTPERLAYHADDYLLNGRGIQNAAERARVKTQLLSRPPTEGGTRTVRLSPNVIAAEHELADALELLGVDRIQAANRASNLANLARNDAHQAIVVGAWQSRAPPAAIRQQFGLTDAQMARSLDRYLDNYLGMRDPAARNRFIADQFFGRGGQPTTPDAVAAMLSRQPVPPPPLRALAAANPPPAPIPPPPPRPRPSPGLAADLNSRFGPAQLPQGFRLEERLPGGGIRPNTGVSEAKPGAPLRLNPDVGYLWLIDERGRLLVAQERFVFENGRPVVNQFGDPGRLGHPAMVDGRPARIAGELRYVEGRGWVLDNSSGRYSQYNKGLTTDHLENAAELFQQSGVRVQTQFRTD